MMAGSSAARPLDDSIGWRELGPEDLDDIEILHRLAVGPVVRPDIVKPESRAYFASILNGRGRVIGAFEGRLIAYGILQHDHSPADDPRPELGLAPGASVGRLAGASVAPAFRGRGLQRITIAARVAMAPPDMALFSTAAPVNTPSWASLLAEGFPIHGVVQRYGGYLRYMMVRDGATYDPAHAVTVDPANLPLQEELFAKGWHGFARTRLACGAPGILFAPPQPRLT
ncbi:hypothetical protein V5F77_05610 [Xanthobacter sp. DSM 24535]|uniref:hypothetical protein n=1 Tax=Roseixanthobacter psychrophilus TaxID=3119917 RepID=UPI003728DB5C